MFAKEMSHTEKTPGDYGHYQIRATKDFEMSYKDSDGAASFFFELGGASGPDVYLYTSPGMKADPAEAQFQMLAFARVLSHLQTVGYTVKVIDDSETSDEPFDTNEFIKIHADAGFKATQNTDGSISVTRGLKPDPERLIDRLKRFFGR